MRRTGEPERGNRVPYVPGISRDGRTGHGQQRAAAAEITPASRSARCCGEEQQRSPNAGYTALTCAFRGPGCGACGRPGGRVARVRPVKDDSLQDV